MLYFKIYCRCIPVSLYSFCYSSAFANHCQISKAGCQCKPPVINIDPVLYVQYTFYVQSLNHSDVNATQTSYLYLIKKVNASFIGQDLINI